MDVQSKESKMKDDSNDKGVNFSDNEEYLKSCHFADQDAAECSSLQYPCITCDRSIDCRYGGFYNYSCTVKPKIVCNVSIQRFNNHSTSVEYLIHS